METHPAAALFPMLRDDELVIMGRDIAENGLQHPVIVWNGLILDGRNRTRACELVGITPRTEDRSGMTEREAVQFVISTNIHRRHLSESQRAMIASELAKLNAHRPSVSAQTCALTQDEAAESMHVSRRSVQTARTVANAGKDLADRVIKGEITVNKAAQIARRRKAETNPDLADDSVVDATEQRHAEGDTPKARAVLAAVARLDPTELSFIKADLMRILGVAA